MTPAARAAGLVLVTVAALGGCGGDDGGSATSDVAVTEDSLPPDVAPLPRIDLLGDAVASVEDELGGPQRYFEVNATASEVNLLVASPDGTEAIAYVYRADGSLEPPAEPQPASGNTFPASAIGVEPDQVLEPVRAQLPESVPIRFSVVGAGGDEAQYVVLLRSVRGGELVVDVEADGTILGGDLTDR